MELVKASWSNKDIEEYHEYLLSISRPEKIDWTTKIINTKMPVLAILSIEIKNITKQIAKGNYISFLELWPWQYYEDSAVIAGLIMQIKDFDTCKKYLCKLAGLADNWATIDSVSFKNLNQTNKNDYFEFSKELVNFNKIFERRLGVDILFKFVKDDDYVENIFSIIASLKDEREYYVNMCVAWLLAECFTFKRERTLKFFEANDMGSFVINKAISKCRDSYRVSASDKEMLLKFKK